ncbi:MAG: CopD family protein [Pseudomonadota bacterium]
MSIALSLHLLAAVVWVGGMFFALMVLRPATVRVLQPPERLLLWLDVLKTFFLWVGFAIAVLLVTGYGMVFGGLGGFAGAPAYVHIMHGTGLLMVAVFGHLVTAPFRRFRAAIDAEAWEAGAAALNGVRRAVLINLGLGTVTVVVAAAGRYGLLG